MAYKDRYGMVITTLDLQVHVGSLRKGEIPEEGHLGEARGALGIMPGSSWMIS